MNSDPFEVIAPSIPPRVKQAAHLPSFRIDPSQIRALVKIAVDASESEILQLIGPTVLLWDDVLYVERGKWRIFLVQLAVLTPMASSLADEGPSGLVHELRLYAENPPSLACQDSDELVGPDVAFVLGALFVGELPFGRLRRELFDTVPEEGVGVEP